MSGLDHPKKPPIRIAVTVDSTSQPAWVARVIETIGRSDFAELASIIVHDSARRQRRGLQAIYERADNAWFGRADDELAERDLREIAGSTPIVHSRDAGVAAQELDLVLAFGTAGLPDLAARARHGVWTCRFDQWPAFVNRSPTTTCTIEVERNGERTTVASSGAATDLVSMRRGTARLAAKAATLLLRSLERLHSGRLHPAPSEVQPLTRDDAGSAIRMISAVGSAAGRYAVQAMRDRRAVEQWEVAFRFGPQSDWSTESLRGFHRMKPPEGHLWADPFVVDEGSRALVFVEELVHREGRGFISVVEAFPDGSYSAARRVLEKPYHLSYPCVFRWNGGWYMVPEAMESGAVELYRAVDFPLRWEPAAVLLHDTKAVDTTLFEYDGRWWMYTATSGDSRLFDELSIFHAESPMGPWTPHPRNPVLSHIAGGRCAGRPFRSDGRMLRAAQIGAPRYGHSMQLREIVTLTPHEWEEREIGTIAPDWAPGLIGTHTLNVDGNVAVIDGARYRWRR